MAAPPGVQGTIEGVLSLLSDLSMGVSPRDKTIHSFSDFFKLVLKRTEEFFVVSMLAVEDAPVVVEGQLVTLQGRDALLAQFTRLGDDVKKGQLPKLADLQPLKTFGWVFGAEQKETVQKWVSAAMSAELSSDGKDKLKRGSMDDGALVSFGSVGLGMVTIGGSSTSSASSSSAVHPSLSSGKALPKARSDETRANVLKFFSAAR